ncbi:hypothetical protein MRX96_035556 [Rhipicephalus microplus]
MNKRKAVRKTGLQSNRNSPNASPRSPKQRGFSGAGSPLDRRSPGFFSASEEVRSRMIQSRLEATAKSYDQEEQLCAVQQVLGALERQGPSEPATASGDPRRVTATPKTT